MLKTVTKIEGQDWLTASSTRAVMMALDDGKNAPMALFVGGAVRNALLGRPVADIDIATVHTPDEVTAMLAKAGIRAIPTGLEHGTVTAVSGKRSFEITTLRRDVSTDGRRAVVAFTTDWAEDAQRRDFTLNTLLADQTGQVYDPTGSGLTDLKAGRIVFVGEPGQRIAEDYLRILRFFRFHAWYGRGAPDASGLAACQAAADKISTLSRERITHELTRILGASRPADILEVMFKNGIMSDLPHPDFDEKILERLCVLQSQMNCDDALSRLFILSGFAVNGTNRFEKYMIFSRAEKDALVDLARVQKSSLNLSEKNFKKLIYKEKKYIALQSVLILLAQKKEAIPAWLPNLVNWNVPKIPIDGNDVTDAGIPPGPITGKLLAAVENWWIEQDFQPDRAACMAELKRLL